MRRNKGFALLDSLLACLALSLALTPMWVVQRQALQDIHASGQRTRALLLAANLAERLRSADSPEARDAVLYQARTEPSGLERSRVDLKQGIVVTWRDAQPYRFHLWIGP